MKKITKIILISISVLVIIVIGLLMYVKFALPNVGPASELKVESTSERIERGAYLANHVTVCIDCHSKRDWTKFSAPPLMGTYGIGGEVFDHKLGFPGTYYASNITPFGIGSYSDGELFRVITTGETRTGRALFPVMPYLNYGKMDAQDIEDIIAYVRTLKPIEYKVDQSVSDFPMNFIINLIPKKASLTKMPNKTDLLAYGKYVTNSAACYDCHTPFEKGRSVVGMGFAGGREFPFGDGRIIRSANLTPDDQTGIGTWSKDVFIQIFRNHSDSATLHTDIDPKGFNSIMPWTMYGGMNDEDLTAIYTFLRNQKPIKNKVIKYTAP